MAFWTDLNYLLTILEVLYHEFNRGTETLHSQKQKLYSQKLLSRKKSSYCFRLFCINVNLEGFRRLLLANKEELSC